jgi:hypothetical protein
MKLVKKIKPRSFLLGFLVKRMKLSKEVSLPLGKKFLKRYKKLNGQAFNLSKKKEG